MLMDESLHTSMYLLLSWIFSFMPLKAIAYYVFVLQIFFFSYLPNLIVLASEDISVELRRHQFPFKNEFLQLLSVPRTFLIHAGPVFSSIIGWKYDCNALGVASARHLFAGLNGPVSLPEEELQFTRLFLPPYLLFVGEVLRNYLSSTSLLTSRLLKVAPVVARHSYLDEIFLSSLINRKVRQVIILGAGYDTRAYRYFQNRKHSDCSGRQSFTSVIEIDQESVQERKRLLLNYGVANRTISPDMTENVMYIPCTFDENSALETALGHHAISPNLNTLFIMEGVTPYISQPVFDQIIHTLRQFRRKATDDVSHTILFDIFTSQSLQSIYAEHFWGLRRVLLRAAVGHPEVCISEDKQELKQELEAMGLLLIDEKNFEMLMRCILHGHESHVDLSFLKSSLTSGIKFIFAHIENPKW